MLTFVNKQQTYLLRTLGWLFGPWNSTDYRSSFEMHKKPVEKVIPSIFERLGQFFFQTKDWCGNNVESEHIGISIALFYLPLMEKDAFCKGNTTHVGLGHCCSP